MDIKDRLKMVIKESSLNLKKFSVKCNIPYQTLQNYLRGERNIGSDALVKIFIQTGININWLLTGEGEKYVDDVNNRKDNGAVSSILEWLNEWWETADVKERHWLEIQIKKCFPEYLEWLENKKDYRNSEK